jgi:hypothetical protein
LDTLSIREVPGSNLGRDIGYPDLGFSWFPSVPPGTCRDSTLNYTPTVSFHILSSLLFTIIHSLDAVYSELRTASLTKLQIKQTIVILFGLEVLTTVSMCGFLSCNALWFGRSPRFQGNISSPSSELKSKSSKEPAELASCFC